MIRRRTRTCRRHRLPLLSSLRSCSLPALWLGLLLTHVGCSSVGLTSAAFNSDGPIWLRGQNPKFAGQTHERAASGKAQELIVRAVEQYAAGKLKAALAAVREARHADPRQTVTLQMEAQICLDVGDRQGYLEALRGVVLASPQSARLNNAVGRLLVQAGEFEEGVAALKKAVSLSPHAPEHALELAAAYFGQGQADNAANVLSEALERTPHDTSLPIALARLHESSGNWKSAARYYEMVMEWDPANPRWQRQLARSLYQLGEYERACRHFAGSFAFEDTQISLAEYIQYGDACLRIGQAVQAQQAFDEVARRSPYRLKEIEVLRGFCALNQGDTTRAKGILNTALTYWPEDGTLREAIKLCDGNVREEWHATTSVKPGPDRTTALQGRRNACN